MGPPLQENLELPTPPSPSEGSTLPDHPPGPFLPEDSKQSTRPYLSDHLPEQLDVIFDLYRKIPTSSTLILTW